MKPKTILLATAAVMLLMAIFPPWSLKDRHLGYGIFFSPLGSDAAWTYYGRAWTPGAINISLLLTQEVIVAAVGAVLYFATSKAAASPPSPRAT